MTIESIAPLQNSTALSSQVSKQHLMLVGQTASVLLASDFFCAQISRFPIYTDCSEASKFQKSEL